jgi:hypothetical protein
VINNDTEQSLLIEKNQQRGQRIKLARESGSAAYLAKIFFLLILEKRQALKRELTVLEALDLLNDVPESSHCNNLENNEKNNMRMLIQDIKDYAEVMVNKTLPKRNKKAQKKNIGYTEKFSSELYAVFSSIILCLILVYIQWYAAKFLFKDEKIGELIFTVVASLFAIPAATPLCYMSNKEALHKLIPHVLAEGQRQGKVGGKLVLRIITSLAFGVPTAAANSANARNAFGWMWSNAKFVSTGGWLGLIPTAFGNAAITENLTNNVRHLLGFSIFDRKKYIESADLDQQYKGSQIGNKEKATKEILAYFKHRFQRTAVHNAFAATEDKSSKLINTIEEHWDSEPLKSNFALLFQDLNSPVPKGKMIDYVVTSTIFGISLSLLSSWGVGALGEQGIASIIQDFGGSDYGKAWQMLVKIIVVACSTCFYTLILANSVFKEAFRERMPNEALFKPDNRTLDFIPATVIGLVNMILTKESTQSSFSDPQFWIFSISNFLVQSMSSRFGVDRMLKEIGRREKRNYEVNEDYIHNTWEFIKTLDFDYLYLLYAVSNAIEKGLTVKDPQKALEAALTDVTNIFANVSSSPNLTNFEVQENENDNNVNHQYQ